jgi:hypothetical protein
MHMSVGIAYVGPGIQKQAENIDRVLKTGREEIELCNKSIAL